MASEQRADVPVGERVEVERIDILYQHTRTTLVTNVLLASALAAVLWPLAGRAQLLGWWGGIVVLVLVRLVLVLGYRQRQPERAREWAAYLTLVTLLSGALWGMAGVLFFFPHSALALSFVTIILAGLAAGSVPAYSSWPPAQYAAIPTTLPIAVRYMAEGGEFWLMGLICVLYLFNVLSSSRQLSRVIEESIRLRLEKQALARRLEDEKAQADEARARAEDANQAKSRFLAAASHDLRQPLQAIHLLIEVLRHPPETESADTVVERLADSAQALDELLDDLLDISRLEAGLMTPRPVAVAVDELLARLEREMRPVAEEKGLELCFVPTRLWVRSDPQMLMRILRNIVGNAIRHTGRGAVLVGCRRRGDAVGIAVCDTGPGIAAEHHQTIFREFHQLGNPERDRRKGLGLGLAIVDGLCRLLGHRVELRSTVGRGSSFEVLVPRAVPGETLVATENVWQDELHGCVVLLIDDDPAVLQALATVLAQWQCVPLLAETIDGALAELARGACVPEVIVSDYRLRDGLTGDIAIAAVRGVLGRDVPAAILTGDTAPARLREAAAGDFLLLHKPVRPARLRAALAVLRERARQPVPPAQAVGRGQEVSCET